MVCVGEENILQTELMTTNYLRKLHEQFTVIKQNSKQKERETWMDLESIMLSEISQAVKDKYHMISPISGT